jgi:hypothetical protein
MASNASTGKTAEVKKRTATTEDMKRLILFYKYMAAAMDVDRTLASEKKKYLDRVKQGQQVVSLRETDAAKAASIEEALSSLN